MRRSQVVRAACPAPARLVGSTYAVGFDQTVPPTSLPSGALSASGARSSEGVVVARVNATVAAGPRAERAGTGAVCEGEVIAA